MTSDQIDYWKKRAADKCLQSTRDASVDLQEMEKFMRHAGLWHDDVEGKALKKIVEAYQGMLAAIELATNTEPKK